MTVDWSLYPPNWPEISLRIRTRDGWRCQFCGAEYGFPHPVTGKTVVLSVAHLDHDESNNDDSNLRSLCAGCHLRYDAPDNRLRVRRNSERRQRAAGQLALLLELTT